MQLKDIMTRDVEVIHPEATVQEAAEKMQKLDVGPLPVCDGKRLVGILTDRDITVRSVARGDNPMLAKVGKAMTPDIIFCYEDDDVQKAAQVMKDKQIRRLPVLNRNKELVGIVSLGDLADDTGDERLA